MELNGEQKQNRFEQVMTSHSRQKQEKNSRRMFAKIDVSFSRTNSRPDRITFMDNLYQWYEKQRMLKNELILMNYFSECCGKFG